MRIARRHPTRQRRSRLAIGALLAIALACGVVARPAAVHASDPLAAAQARVQEATRRADEAVGAYNAAEAKYYELENDAESARRTIGRLKIRQHSLAKLAQARAVIAYQGGPLVIDELVGLNTDVMDAARRATLLDRVNADSNDAIDRLTQVTDDVHARERALRDDAAKQKHALADLQNEEQAANHAVDDAKNAEQALREKLAAEKRLAEYVAMVTKARAAARAATMRAAAARSGGGGVGGRVGQVIGGGGSWVCPVQGSVSFHDDWGDPRSGGRHHKGTDMFSPRGTPVVAPVAGSVFFQGDRLGGNAAYVQGNDGNTYYMAHLNNYVGGARSVKQGEVVGAVGNTGNADGGPTHLHFEIRPGGPNGAQIDPYPTLAAHC